MVLKLHVGALLAALMAWSSAGCGSSTTPANPVRPSPDLTSLEIVGPSDLPPGASAQFTLMARFSDGSSRDLTADALWGIQSAVCSNCTSSEPFVASVSNTGFVTVHARGEARIIAITKQEATATKDLVFVPEGTFRLSGVIHDATSPATAIPEARVEVTAGTRLVVSTDERGAFRVYGVSGPTLLTVTKNGYDLRQERLDVHGHQTANLDLTPSTDYW